MTDCTTPSLTSNIFSIIRDPNQPTLDNPNTNPPIEDFQTGFEGYSDTDLRQYAKQRIADLRRQKNHSLTTEWIAVLDQRSAAEGNVVIHHYMEKSEWEDSLQDAEQEVRIPGQADVNEAEDSVWWKLRVPFGSAFNLWNNVESLGWEGLELYCRPEYLGEDGVVQAHIPDQIVTGDFADTKGMI